MRYAKVVKFIKAGSRVVVGRGWEEGNEESLCNGNRILVMQDGTVLEICYATLCFIVNNIVLYTQTFVWRVDLILCIF